MITDTQLKNKLSMLSNEKLLKELDDNHPYTKAVLKELRKRLKEVKRIGTIQ